MSEYSIERSFMSRKFWFAAVAWVTTTVFFGLGQITEYNYLESTRWILGLYFTANVGSALAAYFGTVRFEATSAKASKE